MHPFWERDSFRDYSPQKPSEHGMKLFILAQSALGTYGILRCAIRRILKDTSAARAVEFLLSQLTNKGHTVHVEHFYTSLPLATELAEVNTGLEETIIESQKGMPKALTGANKKRVNMCYTSVLGLWWVWETCGL
jgi:hypothetical protein